MTRPNVVWISLESARRDHASVAGYGRRTTPNLERIAARPQGISFSKAFSNGTWTPASTACMLTGTHLSTHGVGIHAPTVNKLPETLRTLPDLLADVGYTSLGIVNNAYVTAGTELDRGFDEVLDPGAGNLLDTVGPRAVLHYLLNLRRLGPGLTRDTTLHKIAPMSMTAAKRWLRTDGADDEPVFLYAHLNDSHYPYTPPEPFLEPFAAEIGQSPEEITETSVDVLTDVWRVVADGLPLSDDEMAAITAAYDADLAYVDHFVGELFDAAEAELSGDTIFVVTGDHGEAFGEYGWLGHHVLKTNELFSVPLVVYGLPEIEHQREEIVQHVDVTRTVAAAAGVETEQFEGVDLTTDRREYAIGQRASWESDREKLLEKNPDFDVSRHRWDAVNCIWDEEFKFVTGEDGEELFELPDESTNVGDEYPSVADRLRRELAARDVGLPETDRRDRADFDEEAYQRLREMGYVE